MLSKYLPEENIQDTQTRKIKSESDELSKMLNIKSPNLGSPEGHSERVALYAISIGKRLDLPDKTLKALKSAAILHDIGKIGISQQIVNKLGSLTDREFEIMRLHSNIAIRMLERIPGIEESLPMIKHHHERFEGKGYPDGLEGHNIPLGARIIAVAETFDMLLSDLPWRESCNLKEALTELERCSGTQFDPAIVEVFVKLVKEQKVELPEDVEVDEKRNITKSH